MDASSQAFQNKRGRDANWNGGFGLPEAKRTNSGFMAFFEKIDYMDNNNRNAEDPDSVNGGEGEGDGDGEMEVNKVINTREDEIGLKALTDHNIQSTDEKCGAYDDMGLLKQGDLIAEGSNSEETSVYVIGDHFTYYEDVSAELGFFVDHISPDELGIIFHYIYGDSMANIMYSEPVHADAEFTEVFCGSLWDGDI